MKLFIVSLSLIVLSGCSSLITRSDLKECANKCGSVEKIQSCHKDDGKMSCDCK